MVIYSLLSRYSTARGSSTGLSQEGPSKVKACKSFLFTKGSLEVENKEHLVDFVVTLYFTSLCFNVLRSGKASQSTFKSLRMKSKLVKLLGLVEIVTKMVTGYLSTIKIAIFVLFS